MFTDPAVAAFKFPTVDVAAALISVVADKLSKLTSGVCTAFTVVFPVNTFVATAYLANELAIPTDIVYDPIVPPENAVVGTIFTSCIYPFAGSVYILILLVNAAAEKSEYV
jgi:hypothetical protein